MLLTAAAYYYDYQDFQTIVRETVASFLISKMVNAGNAAVTGLDLKIFSNPSENLDLSFGIGDEKYAVEGYNYLVANILIYNSPRWVSVSFTIRN